MTAIQDDRFYPVTEVADLIGVNYRTVLNEIHTGRLHAVPVGPKPIYRVPGWALRNYQERQAPGASALLASLGNCAPRNARSRRTT